MGFSDLLRVLELVALAAIVGLQYQLLKEFRLLRRRLDAGREKKDGQTINVNLTPVAMSDNKSAPAPAPAPVKPEPEPLAEPEEEPPPEPPKPRRTLASVTVTPGGAIAVKCPKCGAENSSFRSECFSCGANLH